MNGMKDVSPMRLAKLCRDSQAIELLLGYINILSRVDCAVCQSNLRQKVLHRFSTWFFHS